LKGWRRGNAPAGSASQGLQIRINEAVGFVHERLMRRIYRNKIGDWCAGLGVDDQTLEEVVFDHHPSVATMRALRICGTEISDDILDQGAEGINMRRRARPADEEDR